jgi:TonB family protein
MIVAFIAATVAAAPQATAIDPGSWFSSDNYPFEALKKGIEGSVTFEVDVDPEGKPTICRVAVSSGNQALDQTTCDIVRAKGRFVPTKGRGGKPVAGRYRNVAMWRLPDLVQAGYRAMTLDFGADADKPICTTEEKGAPIRFATCDQLVAEIARAGVSKRIRKATFMISMASGSEDPYRGEPSWGQRQFFLASEQYYRKGPIPIACIKVAAEGNASKLDPCRNFPGPTSLSEEDKRTAMKARVEVSMFVLPRRSLHGVCKEGQDQACN